MPRLPDAKEGVELTAYNRSVPFSLWPTGSGRRPPVQSLLFAIDPWVIMRRAIIEQTANADSRSEALSYIEQAADFYTSALSSRIGAAKPVQLYYSYLNVAKAFIICRGVQPSLPSIAHGINEGIAPNGTEFDNAYTQFWTSPNPRGQMQAFDEYMHALQAPRLANQHQVPLPNLVPQILSGHRLWSAATRKQERFIATQRIQFMEARQNHEVWIRVYLYADDLSRLGVTQNALLTQSGLNDDFHKVKCSEAIDGRLLICLEHRNATIYGRHGVDFVNQLVAGVKNRLWATVGSSPPYRRYYLYLCPPAERPSLLPQLASIYALTFYLGSVTRYRPNAFQTLIDGVLGPRMQEFISGQPAQFVYLMASEFARRDITKPSIV